MKKISLTIVAIVLVYLVLAFFKNSFDTDEYDGTVTKIIFSSIEKGSFGTFPNFQLKASSTNPKHGWIYIISPDCKNCPDEILPNKEYSVYLCRYQAHSWLDFLKFGTKYDYKIYKFAKN
jgi:hypothetical protein